LVLDPSKGEIGARADPEPTRTKIMTTHVSLTGLSVAVMLFVIGVTMHEAARADHSSFRGTSLIAEVAIAHFP
jgi:hypothetical protein